MRATSSVNAHFGPCLRLSAGEAEDLTLQLEALRRRLPLQTHAWERLAVEAALCDLAEGRCRAGDLLRCWALLEEGE